MKKYCIYYITTDRYVNYAPDFFKSLSNFMPNDYKTVIWLSDNFIQVDIDDKIDILKKNILDMPWPLVTLLKMHYIYDNKINGYDGYFYFNADAYIENMQPEIIDLISHSCDNNFFITTAHGCYPLDLNYSQGGFFGGSYNIFFKVCNLVVEEINNLLRQNIILEWHDETALNNILNNEINNIKIIRYGFMYDERSLCSEEYVNMIKNAKYLFIKIRTREFKKQKNNY